ncbi:MAG TPA: uracil-DNA glycosylase [Polyangiaceae bacterium]|jgi:uracil-DNA glycosylase family 4
MASAEKETRRRLGLLHQELVGCTACPRLVAWREEVARVKVRRFRDRGYWGKPVPGFGDPAARLILVGLAPGAHGANRTGRVFTGDRSGDFLYAALHRAGFANQPASVSADDGLRLSDAYVLTAVRCVPPGNTPRPDEIRRCGAWLAKELTLLPRARVFLALGAIAWNAMIPRELRPRPRFAHGAEHRLEARGATVLGSYHVSQQNTQTGRLTEAMFGRVLDRARALMAAHSH